MSSGSSRRWASNRFRPRRGGFDDGFLVISSGLIHLARPIAPVHQIVDGMSPVISQASNDITASIPSWRFPGFIISSIHLIPFPSWSVSPVISSAHLVMRLGQASHNIPGTSTGTDEASKRTRKPGRENGTRNRGARRGEDGTNTTRQRGGDGARTDDKQAANGRRGYTTQ